MASAQMGEFGEIEKSVVVSDWESEFSEKAQQHRDGDSV